MLKDFFTYRQKSDRIAILLLISLIVVAVLIIAIVGNTTDSADAFADSTTVLQSVKNTRKSSSSDYYAVEGRKIQLTVFDPNTADSTQLLGLGLQPWQVRSIYRYRAKGGIYRKPSDFARLYGLTVKQYRQLEPYIHISADYQPASTLVDNDPRHVQRDTSFHSRYNPTKIAASERISLDEADTAQLKRIPGIGSYYAQKIVAYGKRLGGYTSIEQLNEIENFPSEAKTYFKMGKVHVEKMNLNKLTVAQMRRHPYMNYFRAKVVWDYRRLHGPLTSLQDLRLSKDFPPKVIQQLQPYVEF